ncbi:MAG: sodium:solute symporter family protein, partial [Planctomycetes bacterium]|nr:sodium:solute symporter family protein [Planctomycetota bacterium]
ELGLITVMYSAQKGFTGGFAAFHIGLVAGIVALIVGFTGFIVVPLREMGVMTIPEFYQRRFSRGVRVMGGAILALAGILNMGLFLKAGSVFVTGLTGMTSQFELNIVMTVLLVLVLFYTTLGGMISVVITDYIQFIVLSVGMLVACVLAVNHLGWTNILTTVRDTYGEAGFNPFHGDGFGPSYVMWQIFVAGLVSCAIWQTAVMRACSAESTAVVKRLYIWSSIGFMIRFLIPNLLGICALVFLTQHESLRTVFFPADGPPSPDATLSAMPVFLSQILPVGLIGLVAAAMLAAFMSTSDSYLLCWSSVITQDVIGPMTGDTITTKTRLKITRLLIVTIGIFLLVWSLWYPLEQDMWDYMAVTGAIYFTGAFTLLVGGIYWRRASSVGAYASLACGFGSLLGLEIFRDMLGLGAFKEKLTADRVGLTAVAACVVAMIAGSLLFPDRGEVSGEAEGSKRK